MELNRPDPVDGPVSGSVPGITSRSLGRRRQTRGGEGISWVQYFCGDAPLSATFDDSKLLA